MGFEVGRSGPAPGESSPAARPSGRAADPHFASQRARRTLTGLAFITPALALYGAFFLLPLGQVVKMSTEQWDGLAAERPFVGIENFVTALASPQVVEAVAHNLLWVVTAVIPIALGLGLAVLLHHAQPRGRTAYRLVYFLPYTLPIVVVALVFKWLYNPIWGPINAVLARLTAGKVQPGWLGDPTLALASLTITGAWVGFGFCMVLYLSALPNISSELYDAAKVDGANAWQRFRNVTVPGVATMTNVVVLVVFMATIRVFDVVFIMTRGGPITSTEVLGTLVFRETFEFQEVGYGAAIAVITAMIILVPSLIYLRLRDRR